MNTSTATTSSTTRSSSRRSSTAWRFAFAASAVAMLVGAPRHPESDAKDSLRDELATMTAHDDWVFAHAFVVLSSILLAAGLWLARRRGSWPTSTRRALAVASVMVSLYVVETVFHLASAVDTEALRDGRGAPVAFTHIALALVLYPLSGVSIAYLAARLFATVDLPRKAIATAGVIGGAMHAVSVPLTVALPDVELTPLFAGSAILLSLWSLGIGLLGLGSAARARGDRTRASVDTGEMTEQVSAVTAGR